MKRPASPLRAGLLAGFLTALLCWVMAAAPVEAEDSGPTTTTAATAADVTIESFSVGPGGSLDPSLPGDRTNFSYDAAPGTVVHDTAVVYNVGNVPLPFHVYATDGFNQQNGAFDLLTGDATPVDVGSWVHFDSQDLTVPPGKEAVIPITITIPADARPGDHVGGVVASSPIEGKNDTGQVVTLDRRVAAKLYVRVTGATHPELAITKLDTEYSHAVNPFGGSAKVTFRVENRGDVRLSGAPKVSVSGPFGIGETSVTLPAFVDLLPGGHADLTATLDGVGAWFIDSTEVTITPVDGADFSTVKVLDGSAMTFAPPLTLIGALVVAIAVWMWVRRRRRRREARADITPARPVDDLVGAGVR